MKPNYRMLKVNLHSHFIDFQHQDPWPVIEYHKREGFHVLALTEHGHQTDLGMERRAAAKARRRYGSDFIVIVGKECTAAADPKGRYSANDLTAIFLKENVLCWDEQGRRVGMQEQLDEIHRQGGIAIVNHEHTNQLSPNPKKRLWHHREEFDLDGWELGSGGGLQRGNGDAVLMRHPEQAVAEEYLTVSSSDSHRDFHALTLGGYCHTWLFVDDVSHDGVYEGLKARRTVSYVNGFVFGQREWLERYADGRIKTAQRDIEKWQHGKPGRNGTFSASSLFALRTESELLSRIVDMMQHYHSTQLTREYYLGEHDKVSLFILTRSSRKRVRRALWKMMVVLSRSFAEQGERSYFGAQERRLAEMEMRTLHKKKMTAADWARLGLFSYHLTNYPKALFYCARAEKMGYDSLKFMRGHALLQSKSASGAGKSARICRRGLKLYPDDVLLKGLLANVERIARGR